MPLILASVIIVPQACALAAVLVGILAVKKLAEVPGAEVAFIALLRAVAIACGAVGFGIASWLTW